MARAWQLSICAAALALATATAGCRQNAGTPPRSDAAVDAGGDGGGLTPLTLDIAVTGCATFDVGIPACSGVAPLAINFSPVGSPVLSMFLWEFGDGSPPSSDRAPMHTYTLPGTYAVMVTGSGVMGGMTSQLSQTRMSFIVVRSVATGAACDVDAQCGDGLRCLCQPGSGCGAAFLRGFCSTNCPTGFCGSGASCAIYPLGTVGDAGADGAGDAASGSLTGPLCLASCQTNADCSTGFVCQSFPAGGSGASGWSRACLPLGAAGDLGASCRNAVGALDDSRCSTGVCADVGQLGLCSGACDATHACPAGADCAALGGGRQLCLPSCSSTQPCSGDPGLSCRSAVSDGGSDSDGGTGFSIVVGDANASYCAPL